MIKKIIYILILIVISVQIVCAKTENAYLEYSGFTYEFAPGDDVKFSNNANKNLILAEKTKSQVNKRFYLNEAMRYYFLLAKFNPNSVEAQIGLGRVYDSLGMDKYAQKHFYNAINLDMHNPKVNYYFGNYYFARNDFINAQNYYNIAYRFGYIKNYYINYKLGTIYEKLGDIETAIKYYYFALRLNPKNVELRKKIRSLDDLKYSHSQYYLFK